MVEITTTVFLPFSFFNHTDLSKIGLTLSFGESSDVTEIR